jgi:hypothetical protein
MIGSFAPTNLRGVLQAMADAQQDDADQLRAAVAREKINTCQTKLDRVPGGGCTVHFAASVRVKRKRTVA